jgi:hypothetical protein
MGDSTATNATRGELLWFCTDGRADDDAHIIHPQPGRTFCRLGKRKKNLSRFSLNTQADASFEVGSTQPVPPRWAVCVDQEVRPPQLQTPVLSKKTIRYRMVLIIA